ncbi:response regulator transcription factor [Arthrobacter sp. I2-34]|uniref:Response regulator transcription factor n=1 Tax=Arthrobacter hankyongi TaxID=2904801 RepID=A0ABS9LDS0_9MICC|nr:response regulator transcription factor [Arthrobacter hankyongi]MCG2624663.1 response regulator transcription factor [Arthrobacter hankyongi]
MSTTLRPHVLLVEDDNQLGPLIVELLAGDFDVTLARDGQQGLHLGLTRGWDALVIDRGLPLLDGIGLITALRRKGIAAPILVLTALGSVPDKVDGLDAGANDYLVKPFDAAELAARLRAMTRSYGAAARTLDVGQWSFDPEARILASPYGDSLVLSPREAGLLALLAREPDRTFSREEILGAVFDRADQAGSVDTYVYYLRRKLGHDVVRTVRGAGYRLGEPS